MIVGNYVRPDFSAIPNITAELQTMASARFRIRLEHKEDEPQLFWVWICHFGNPIQRVGVACESYEECSGLCYWLVKTVFLMERLNHGDKNPDQTLLDKIKPSRN